MIQKVFQLLFFLLFSYFNLKSQDVDTLPTGSVKPFDFGISDSALKALLGTDSSKMFFKIRSGKDPGLMEFFFLNRKIEQLKLNQDTALGEITALNKKLDDYQNIQHKKDDAIEAQLKNIKTVQIASLILGILSVGITVFVFIFFKRQLNYPEPPIYDGKQSLPKYEEFQSHTSRGENGAVDSPAPYIERTKEVTATAPQAIPSANENIPPPPKEDVNLALSFPAQIKLKKEFTIRVSAYLEEDKGKIENLLTAMAPNDQNLLDVENCKWQRGTIVKVRVYSTLLIVSPEVQEFEWVGKAKILNFDASVNDMASIGDALTIRADILIADIIISRLRASVFISGKAVQDENRKIEIRGVPIKTAFASYASADTNLVIGRLSEIERNGVKIFWDRLSLQTGEDWKSQLSNAIKQNDAFFLFWSSNAKSSRYVEWEWKTALDHKGLEAIEPHPLESPETAPPPDELSSLHFDDKYLYFRKS